MHDKTFSGKDPKLIIAFLQDFTSASSQCEVDDGAAMQLLKQYLTRATVAAMKSRTALRNSVNTGHVGEI